MVDDNTAKISRIISVIMRPWTLFRNTVLALLTLPMVTKKVSHVFMGCYHVHGAEALYVLTLGL